MSELLPEEIPDELLEEPGAPSGANDEGRLHDELDGCDVSSDLDAVDSDGTPELNSDRLVPVWLAATVLALLLAVMALGGFALRGVFEDPPTLADRDLEVEKWESQVKLTPDDNQARLNLGFAYQRAKRMDDALDQYEVVLDDAPDDTAALYNKGIVLRSTNRDQEAEEIWWRVLEIEPQHILAAKALGEYYAERREYRSLLEAVRPVVKENESSADLQYLMGLAYENLGRRDWAGARYELALKYYPDMKEAREGLERIGREQ